MGRMRVFGQRRMEQRVPQLMLPKRKSCKSIVASVACVQLTCRLPIVQHKVLRFGHRLSAHVHYYITYGWQ